MGLYFILMSETFKLRYPNYGCLYLVNQKGTLRILYTPFRVLCIKDSGVLKKDTWVYVEAVMFHAVFGIAYLVNGKEYPYNHFIIQINF